MSSPHNTCKTEFDQEVQTFNTIVGLSLALTFIRFVVYKSLRPARRRKMARYSVAMGVLKLGFAGLLGTVFWPSCPPSCMHCSFDSVYPFVAFLIGVFWIWEGIAASQISPEEHAQASASEGDIVFASIPTEEQEDAIKRQEMPEARAEKVIV